MVFLPSKIFYIFWFSKLLTLNIPDEKNVDIKFSVHDEFLDWPSLCARMVEGLENQIIEKSLGVRNLKSQTRKSKSVKACGRLTIWKIMNYIILELFFASIRVMVVYQYILLICLYYPVCETCTYSLSFQNTANCHKNEWQHKHGHHNTRVNECS